ERSAAEAHQPGTMRKEYQMQKWVTLVVAAVLLGWATAADNAMAADEAAANEATPTLEDMHITIKALKMQVKDQQRRLVELEVELSDKTGRRLTPEETLALVKKVVADAGGRSDWPKWMENLKFYGDLRLRYQGDCFSGSQRGSKNRNRARFRLRFGVTKHWLDKQMEVGFRLASGSEGYRDCARETVHGYSDATSSNQTFSDFFSEKPIWIDLAYAKYAPDWLKGFTIIGGKMKNPYVHTDLVWDSDVNPEGVWTQYKPTFNGFSPFASVGYFVVDESGNGKDVILAGYQAGMHWKLTKDVQWTCAATYYDYDNFEEAAVYSSGNHQDTDPCYYLAEEFQMFNLTNKVKFKAFGLPMQVYFDWVHNCGDSDSAPDYNDQSDGYAVGLKVGKNKKKGDWSAGYKYAYIEANATVGAFNDSDFGHANRRGHVFSAKYNLADPLTIGGKVFYTEPVTGSHENERNVTVQADLVWKF
ncbi:MAG: putative porin, partial [Planctomycetota bacterium]|nr:putative porin [Planctomycetota bacterium]